MGSRPRGWLLARMPQLVQLELDCSYSEMVGGKLGGEHPLGAVRGSADSFNETPDAPRQTPLQYARTRHCRQRRSLLQQLVLSLPLGHPCAEAGPACSRPHQLRMRFSLFLSCSCLF